MNFTESCAGLGESENIRVNAVLPGIVDTPIIAKTGDGTTPAKWLEPALAAATMLQPEDIAEAVLGPDPRRLEGRCGRARDEFPLAGGGPLAAVPYRAGARGISMRALPKVANAVTLNAGRS